MGLGENTGMPVIVKTAMDKTSGFIFPLLIVLYSCNLNFYGDVDLGSNFYYLVEPAFNSIVIPVNPDAPYEASIYVIKDIEAVGFNDDYILATSLKNDTVHCWIIDKTIASEELGYDNNSIVILSNVKEVDLADFGEIFSSSHIKMKSKTEYRRELNYE